MSDIGWISIHRKIRDCAIWASDEPFDRRSAWVDLLMMANHEDAEIVFNGKPLTVKMGQRITSIRILAERWHWSVNKVRRYLELLQKLEMIHKECDNHRTLLTIVNYGKYQGMRNTDEYTDEYTDGTQTNTQTEHARHTNNNDNNDNNENNENKHICQSVLDMYNSICVSLPKAVKLNNARRTAIKARLKMYSIDDFEKMFTLAEESDFLKGNNDQGWKASLDWMIKDSNMTKVLEGQYQNREKSKWYKDDYDMIRDWVGRET